MSENIHRFGWRPRIIDGGKSEPERLSEPTERQQLEDLKHQLIITAKDILDTEKDIDELSYALGYAAQTKEIKQLSLGALRAQVAAALQAVEPINTDSDEVVKKAAHRQLTVLRFAIEERLKTCE